MDALVPSASDRAQCHAHGHALTQLLNQHQAVHLVHSGRIQTVIKFFLLCILLAFGTLYVKNQLGGQLVFSRSSLSRPLHLANPSQRMVLFHHIPKTGFEALEIILQRHLASRVPAIDVQKKDGPTATTQYKSQGRFAEAASAAPKPSVWSGHFLFLDFAFYSLPVPLWISLVCDPISKYRGHFHGRRVEGKAEKNYRKMLADAGGDAKMSLDEWRKRDLSDCVLQGDPECSLHEGQTMSTPIRYFCGYHVRCSEFGSQWALTEAKRNVEQYYAVVGIYEHWDETLRALERELPFYFQGVQESYHQEGSTQAMLKLPTNTLTPAAEKKLREQLSVEYEFYNFLVTRLRKQAVV